MAATSRNSATRIADVAAFLETFAPSSLAEDWDNVGLLVGDDNAPVERVMTCLTITPASAREAIAAGANLIVTHHPLPFRALKQLTTATPEGRLLLDLIAARVAIYSPHTAFDSTARGINQQLAEGLGLHEIQPLVPASEGTLGSGRQGRLDHPLPLKTFAERVKAFLHLPTAQIVGAADREVTRVAIACGSAGEFLSPAKATGCDCLLTGEVRFHTALEAEATGISLVLTGHYASERFGVEQLATVLTQAFPLLHIWPSHEEADPLMWV